jgi:hypothetical protein
MASDVSSSTPRFFVLEKQNKGHHDTEYSKIKLNIGPPLSCPQCGGPIGMLSWQPPYRVELELHGKDFGDLMEGSGGDLLVTERFAEDFKAEGFTGLTGFHPVEVMRVRRRRREPHPAPPPRYLVVTPTYGPPALDVERSRFKSSKPVKTCTWCRKITPDAIAGLTLEAGTWRGEDVFRPRGLWGVLIVSERFMRFAERHAMSHMTLVPIEKYVWDPLGLYEGEHLA